MAHDGVRVLAPRPLLLAALVVAAAVGAGQPVRSQTPPAETAAGVDQRLLAGLAWRSIGPEQRRTVHRLRRQPRPAQRVLLRRDRRRALEDHRRGHDLAARHRRTDQEQLGRGRGRVRVQPRRGLPRHGRDPAARQRHAGRRRVPVVGRRPDVDAPRPLGHAGHRPDPRAPREPRPGLRGGAGPSVRTERRARRLPIDATAGGTGRASSSATTAPARWTSIWTPTTRGCSTRRCGRSIARRGCCRAAGRAPASSSRPTAARRGRRSRATRGSRRASSARSRSRCPAPTVAGSTRWSKPTTAASSGRTTRARRGPG